MTNMITETEHALHIQALETEIKQLQCVNVEIERRYVNVLEDNKKYRIRLALVYVEALRWKKLFYRVRAAKRANALENPTDEKTVLEK